MDFDGAGCCCLCAGFQGLNDTSLMASVVLWAAACYNVAEHRSRVLGFYSLEKRVRPHLLQRAWLISMETPCGLSCTVLGIRIAKRVRLFPKEESQ